MKIDSFGAVVPENKIALADCSYIYDYIEQVRAGEVPACEEQHQLILLIEDIFGNEDLYIHVAQLEKYLSYQKYFAYELLSWEIFCFALHNCVYKADGSLRFPDLAIYIGRGGGKNGYEAFEDFCLLCEANGVSEYDIDIFAMSEEQAKTSYDDVYNVLDRNEKIMKQHCRWTKECITNKRTNSRYRFRTSSSKTKDGGRPGKIAFDELHAYENAKLIDVAVGGLGKKPFPRKTIITTDGNVRGGVLDDELIKWRKILARETSDNGTLPFICRLDKEEEIHDPKMWVKANPSFIPAFKNFNILKNEMLKEYQDFKENPVTYSSFATKRMNRPVKESENSITDFSNIAATNREIPDDLLQDKPCVAGIDYMKTNDFLGVCLLYLVDDVYYCIAHTFVCRNSSDLHRVKAPLEQWEQQGILTFIDGPEIPPEVPIVWLINEANKRNSQIIKVGMDSYRYTWLRRTLNENYFFPDDKGKNNGNIKLIRPSDEMMFIPNITSEFNLHKYIWGDNPALRWAANNSKIETRGVNMVYGKIEPKSRKTDTFKAFVSARVIADQLELYGDTGEENSVPLDIVIY